MTHDDRNTKTLSLTNLPIPAKANKQKVEKANDKDRQLFNEGYLFVDRYLIVKKIGQGAHAEVYQAMDILDDHKLVALKIIKLLDDDDHYQEKHLEMERDAFAKLIFNKNVIGLRDYDRSQNIFYMVIDLADGATNLQNKFRPFNNLLTVDEIIYYFSGIAKGLQGIHQVGIVHRDLKPQNVLINNEEVVKISDFGISRLAGKTKVGAGGFEGTPKYAAPEQYLTSNDIYYQSDIYSVGVMLYEMSCGVTPFAIYKNFKTDKERYTFILNQHLKETVLHPRIFNPSMPIALDNLIMKCLVKDLKIRYQNFDEFYDDLQKINAKMQPKLNETNQDISYLKIRKTLKKTKNYQFDRYFKIFNFRNTILLALLLTGIVLALALAILIS